MGYKLLIDNVEGQAVVTKMLSNARLKTKHAHVEVQ